MSHWQGPLGVLQPSSVAWTVVFSLELSEDILPNKFPVFTVVRTLALPYLLLYSLPLWLTAGSLLLGVLVG